MMMKKKKRKKKKNNNNKKKKTKRKRKKKKKKKWTWQWRQGHLFPKAPLWCSFQDPLFGASAAPDPGLHERCRAPDTGFHQPVGVKRNSWSG